MDQDQLAIAYIPRKAQYYIVRSDSEVFEEAHVKGANNVQE
jgi:hypothetical protein